MKFITLGLLAIVVVLLFSTHTYAIDNGKGRTPPMGWRSWNLFGANVDQQLMEGQMDAMVSRKRLVDGVPTSLWDLGYRDIGLDDNWQLCGSYGTDKFTFHQEDGTPVVNLQRFPNFKAMTSYAHKLQLTSGWYGNNCICSDHCADEKCYRGDVKAAVEYGFDSIKLDGCGKELDLDLYARLFQQAGKSVMIENCHWGLTLPNATWCPWNFYRTSGDIAASYDSVVFNLQSTIPLAQRNLSTPGCWAYPDMLEVGCAHGPHGAGDPGLTYNEARSHFGAWCIVSSPLTLSHDMKNDTISDQVWPIISNKEAIRVNQAYNGHSGTVFDSATEMINLGSGSSPSWQQFYKPITDKETAVLVMNHASTTQTIYIDFSKIPSFKGMASNSVHVRDIWAHADGGLVSGGVTVKLSTHDSAFFTLTLQ